MSWFWRSPINRYDWYHHTTRVHRRREGCWVGTLHINIIQVGAIVFQCSVFPEGEGQDYSAKDAEQFLRCFRKNLIKILPKTYCCGITVRLWHTYLPLSKTRAMKSDRTYVQQYVWYVRTQRSSRYEYVWCRWTERIFPVFHTVTYRVVLEIFIDVWPFYIDPIYLVVQSRFGDKLIGIRGVGPQKGTAVLKGLHVYKGYMRFTVRSMRFQYLVPWSPGMYGIQSIRYMVHQYK